MKRTALLESYGPILLGGLIESERAKAAQLHQAGLGPPPDESTNVVLLQRVGREVLQVLGGLLAENERRESTNKIALVADLATRFCHGAVETTETDEELRNVARRSVRLAKIILGEAALAVNEAKS